MPKTEERKEYEKAWREKFKEEHGISYSVYRERLQVATALADFVEKAGNPGIKAER